MAARAPCAASRAEAAPRLLAAGDWLQGPYVYALYAAYGFSKRDIGRLFIAGFGSSMVFGTVVGSLGDRVCVSLALPRPHALAALTPRSRRRSGRKNAALLYCLTYAASCATKHWSVYSVLLVGRILGGIATSLLTTAFESWLVSEHLRRGYEPQWLSGTFSQAVFLGNGLIAILSGLLANTLVGNAGLPLTAPFDAAALALAVGGALIWYTWEENYGGRQAAAPRRSSQPAAAAAAGGGGEAEEEEEEPSSPASVPPGGSLTGGLTAQFRTALAAISGDPRVGLLGAMQSLFEASMYSFVFLWTPALSPDEQSIPHGMIFATFMLSSMIGSSISSRLLARTDTTPERYMQHVYLVAAVALSVPALVSALDAVLGRGWLAEEGGAEEVGMDLRGQLQYLAFNVFEACVGIFWPSMMKLRSQYVPEELRSTVMNVFRIPLNLFVCVILFNVQLFPIWFMFGLCCAFLLMASVAQRRLERLVASAPQQAVEKSADAASFGH